MQFDKTYLTESGRELATSTQGGLDKIQFTRAVASSHDYSALSIDEIKALTDVADVKQEVQYSRIVKKDKFTLTMRVDFPSKDVTTDYSLYTVGFYARLQNGDEALYGVLPSSLPDYIPAYDGHSNINDSFQTDTTVSDTDNVLITVSQAGTLNESDLDAIFVARHIATIEDIESHLPDTLPDMDKDNDFKGINKFEKDPVDAAGDPYVADKTMQTAITAALKGMLADDGSLTIGDKTFMPVIDNRNGTITVDKAVLTPADADHVVQVNEAGNGSKVNFDSGDLTVDGADAVGMVMVYSDDDADAVKAYATAHQDTLMVYRGSTTRPAGKKNPFNEETGGTA